MQEGSVPAGIRKRAEGSRGLAGTTKSEVLARCRVFHSVPLIVMARHTEAVFPSSSLSCKVIMNISFMFSHIYYSYAQAAEEIAR